MRRFLKLIFLLTAVFMSLVVSGQLNFRHGYVITHGNDTLYGKINDRGGYRNSRICIFKALNSDKAVSYRPEEIKAYRMDDDKYYVSKQVEVKGQNKYVFIDVLIKGKVNLYHHRKSKNMAFYIQKDGGEMIGLANAEVPLHYKYDENVTTLYSPTYILHNKIFRDTLYSVFSDSETITDRIESVEYDPKSLTTITKDYINEVCVGSECIDYERNLNKYRPRFGVFSGVQLARISFLPSIKGMYTLEEKSTIVSNTFTTFPIGIFLNIPMPLISEKLSFQMEVISNGIDYRQSFTSAQNYNDTIIEINTKTIGIPLLLKYELGSGKLSPSISIGKEISFVYNSTVTVDQDKDLRIHPVQKGGWFGEAGVNYKIAPRLSIFANVRFQSHKNLLIVDGNQRATYDTVVRSAHFVKEYKINYSTLLVGLKF